MFVDCINETAEGRAAGNGLGGIDGCWGGCPASLLPATLAFLIRAPQGPSGSGLPGPTPLQGPHPASQPLTPSCPRHSSGCRPRTPSRSAGGAEVARHGVRASPRPLCPRAHGASVHPVGKQQVDSGGCVRSPSSRFFEKQRTYSRSLSFRESETWSPTVTTAAPPSSFPSELTASPSPPPPYPASPTASTWNQTASSLLFPSKGLCLLCP